MVWTEAKNARRCELIDKAIELTLTEEELAELNGLQAEMLEYRRSVAPLPIEEARRLYAELKATSDRGYLTDELKKFVAVVFPGFGGD